MQVWTIGHSTQPLESFLAVLAAHGIEAVADVRRFPGSRRHPHYAREALQEALAARGIAYHWYPALGGRRAPRPDSPNTAWRNSAFRGYADHMQSEDFDAGLAALCDVARRRRTAILCAELLWWRCHRALIADRLKADGVEVLHLRDTGEPESHPFAAAARLVRGKLSYEAVP